LIVNFSWLTPIPTKKLLELINIIYYDTNMIYEDIIETVISNMNNAFSEDSDNFSETRDIFSARIQSYVIATKKYLEAAIIGEIGNNTFDHNFGYINSLPKGVYCNTSYLHNFTILADYGRGLKKTLMAVIPSMTSDLEAIETAFTKRVSGRSPEQRGNGLKFVSEAIQQNKWHLFFQSGTGACTIDKTGITFYKKALSLTGCLAIINFNEDI